MEVIKRDGRIVPFNEEKIINAVIAAFKSVDGEITKYATTRAKNIANNIKEYATKKKNY